MSESLRHRQGNGDAVGHPSVGTVHQFQGSEADIIIFDLVDGPGRSGLGRLLIGDTGIRLVNVVVTRARGKLILLLNRSWTRQQMQREQNPLLWDLTTNHAGALHAFSKAVRDGIEATK